MMSELSQVEQLLLDKRRELEDEKRQLGLTDGEVISECRVRDVWTMCPGQNVTDDAQQTVTGVQLDDSKEMVDNIMANQRSPTMLKAGEFSPNNLVLKYGDVILGLGQYEDLQRRLRATRQKEYRMFLEQQTREKKQKEQERQKQESAERDRSNHNRLCHVAVQTDQEWSDVTCPRHAERELSPRAAVEADSKPSAGTAVSAGRHSVQTNTGCILDEEVISERNRRAELEAIAKKVSYQQELRRQIVEQQRLREQRRAREMLLEQAERRRLDQQLEMLNANDVKQNDKHIISTGVQYEKLSKTLDHFNDDKKRTRPSQSQSEKTNQQTYERSKLPLYYAYNPEKKTNFTMNLENDSIFSPDYSVDESLRRNLNPKFESAFIRPKQDSPNFVNFGEKLRNLPDIGDNKRNGNTSERRLVHDDIPIPVLQHLGKNSPVSGNNCGDNLSDSMRLVESKWSVPVVQRNIVNSNSILTQLGSIRRQLQLEQLKLDKMLGQKSAV